MKRSSAGMMGLPGRRPGRLRRGCTGTVGAARRGEGLRTLKRSLVAGERFTRGCALRWGDRGQHRRFGDEGVLTFIMGRAWGAALAHLGARFFARCAASCFKKRLDLPPIVRPFAVPG